MTNLEEVVVGRLFNPILISGRIFLDIIQPLRHSRAVFTGLSSLHKKYAPSLSLRLGIESAEAQKFLPSLPLHTAFRSHFHYMYVGIGSFIMLSKIYRLAARLLPSHRPFFKQRVIESHIRNYKSKVVSCAQKYFYVL